MRMFTRFALLIAMLLLALPVLAQDEAPDVILEGFAVLPADTFAEGPQSGTAITEANGRIPPFDSQPVQGVSAIIPTGNGTWWAMSDNGFGSKGNSPDYILRVYEVDVDFESGTVEVLGFFELKDPNNLVPWPIQLGDTEERLLTGSDFDIESIRMVADGTFYIGDEFGPFLLHVDADGVLLEAPIPTPLPEPMQPYSRGLEFVQAPQNPAFFDLADDNARNAAANHRTSRGFEGMALNTSGTMLYPLLEGALFDDPIGTRFMMQEFDVATGEYTGNFYFYITDAPNHAIGDMTAINDEEFLVIERDGGEGEAAQFKRIYLVNIAEAASDGVLRKELLVDLLNIADPNGITQPEDGAIGFGEVFSFPFVTIEAVYPIDADTLLVTNDNNYPFSAGRRPGVPDDNEFILVGLPEPLNLAEMDMMGE